MRKTYYLLIMAILAMSARAQQSLNVVQGNVTYSFPANSEVMSFNGGSSLNIQGKDFNLSELSKMEVVNSVADNNTVEVLYSGETATVTIAGNIVNYITATVSGAHVTLDQSDEVGDAIGEITYILKGVSDNGSFVQNGSYKSTFELQGLSLKNPSGAAIDIENGKRSEMSIKKDTENTLVDGAGGKQKAALYCKGHLELKGKGVLNVTGLTAHAISAKEYIEIKNCTINILESVKDGINCNQYFLMESGTLNINNPGDDGIQVSFKDNEGERDEEDTGSASVIDGTIIIQPLTAAASKGIKADNDIEIAGGIITIVSNAPGDWDSDKVKTKASACISADGNILISGGTLDLTATGAGGKCISCDGTFNSIGGTMKGLTTGGALVYRNGTLYQGNYTGNLDNINSDYKSSPKGIKADTEAILSGGIFDITTKGTNGEGIESKGHLTFDGDVVVKVRTYDDATNSSGNTYIKGGTLDVGSTNQGDGIDSNSSIYISGGRTIVFSSPVGSEQGLDSGDGGNYGTFITGGEVLAYGAGGSGRVTATTDSQSIITPSITLSVDAEVQVKTGSGDLLGSFVIPEGFTTTSSGGGGPWGGGNRPGGSSSGNLLISLPGMVVGSSYTVSVGTASVTATAQTSGGGGMGGFGGGR